MENNLAGGYENGMVERLEDATLKRSTLYGVILIGRSHPINPVPSRQSYGYPSLSFQLGDEVETDRNKSSEKKKKTAASFCSTFLISAENQEMML